MRKLSRREFLKALGLGAAGVSLLDAAGIPAEASESPIKLGPFKLQYAEETASICPFCACGCGLLVHTRDGKVINIQGDPDHPINEGALCPKGMSVSDLTYVVNRKRNRVPSKQRMTKVLYRAPHSDHWEEKDWDWALAEIAKRVKKTRDATFETVDENGVTVNRTPAIFELGSASIDNEENYLMHKLCRALGLYHIDHHARL